MVLLAALKNIDVLVADIAGAYLNAPPKEKVHVTTVLNYLEYNMKVGLP